MAFLGMRGTGDWVTDQRPKNWREVILYRYPNGTAPLTAIMSKMASQKVDDPEFNWWTKSLPSQSAAITGVYTDAGLSVAYVSGGTAGDTVYFKMTAANETQFRVGHQVLLRDASDLTVDVNGKVTATVSNGASSYIAVKLLEADDNSTAGDLSDCDTALIIGNINSEGASMPDTIAYDPTKWRNFTQIFRTPLELTRTAIQTRLRTGEQYKESKREALEIHSIEMEKAFMFGISSEGTGDNGKPERTTLGLVPAIRGGYTGHGGTAGTEDNFVTNASYSGQTWLQGGEEWTDEQLELIFRYGRREKLAFAGSGAILGINRLIKNGGNFDYSASTTDYGLQVTKWVTAFGVINIMTHPLMSYETTTRNAMVIFEPQDMKFRYVQDTIFKKDDRMRQGGWTSQDGIKEEYLTEAGMEYHHPDGWGYLYGFNTDNAV
jgi:hypothetical protein